MLKEKVGFQAIEKRDKNAELRLGDSNRNYIELAEKLSKLTNAEFAEVIKRVRAIHRQ